MTAATRDSKVLDLASGIATVPDGSTIALGGNVHNNVAMAAVRELIRQGTADLELIAFGQGMGADLLIGARAVRTLHTNYVAMEHLGLAPGLRRAAESGTTTIVDWDSLGMILALEAGASGAPLAAVPQGIEVTVWPGLSPHVYRRIVNPFTGSEAFVVPPLQPDVALLYVSVADCYGNGQHDGFVFWDELIAQAARRVVLLCEELVSNDDIRRAPQRTTIPSYLVDVVVESPGAAYPCGAPPRYEAQVDELVRYRQAASTTASLDDYLAELRRSSEAESLPANSEES
jgi:glutaconate CoA-transferase subunit A